MSKARTRIEITLLVDSDFYSPNITEEKIEKIIEQRYNNIYNERATQKEQVMQVKARFESWLP